MWRLIAIGTSVAVIHLALVAYILSKTTYSRGWQVLHDILAFPLVYVDRLNYQGAVPGFLDFDWMPFLVVLNSALWGAALAAAWYWWRRHRAVRKSK